MKSVYIPTEVWFQLCFEGTLNIHEMKASILTLLVLWFSSGRKVNRWCVFSIRPFKQSPTHSSSSSPLYFGRKTRRSQGLKFESAVFEQESQWQLWSWAGGSTRLPALFTSTSTLSMDVEWNGWMQPCGFNRGRKSSECLLLPFQFPYICLQW